jgi:hypothetical protein
MRASARGLKQVLGPHPCQTWSFSVTPVDSVDRAAPNAVRLGRRVGKRLKDSATVGATAPAPLRASHGIRGKKGYWNSLIIDIVNIPCHGPYLTSSMSCFVVLRSRQILIFGSFFLFTIFFLSKHAVRSMYILFIPFASISMRQSMRCAVHTYG